MLQTPNGSPFRNNDAPPGTDVRPAARPVQAPGTVVTMLYGGTLAGSAITSIAAYAPPLRHVSELARTALAPVPSSSR